MENNLTLSTGPDGIGLSQLSQLRGGGHLEQSYGLEGRSLLYL